MVKTLICSEVSGIVAVMQEMAFQGAVGPGHNEMPWAVRGIMTRVCTAVVGVWDQAYCGLRKLPNFTPEWRIEVMLSIMAASFNMGRMFGKLEAAKGLKHIAKVVPMYPTEWKTAEYETVDDYKGEE